MAEPRLVDTHIPDWQRWVTSRKDGWSHVHASGLLLWQNSSWFCAAGKLVLADSPDLDVAYDGSLDWPQEARAFHVALPIDALSGLVTGILGGKIPIGTIPDVWADVVFDLPGGRRMDCGGPPRLEGPDTAIGTVSREARWPRYALELQGATLSEWLGPDTYKRMESLDDRLASKGFGTLSEIRQGLGVGPHQGHFSSLMNMNTTFRLLAPLHLRIDDADWSPSKKELPCTVSVGTRIQRSLAHLVLRYSGQPFFKPVPLPPEGASPLRVLLSMTKPGTNAEVRLSYMDAVIHSHRVGDESAAGIFSDARTSFHFRDDTPERPVASGGRTRPARRTKADLFESAFNTYRVTDGVLGEGGAGRVFAVEDRDGTQLAAKVLSSEKVNTETVRRFKNELLFGAQERQNIVRVLDWGFTLQKRTKCPFYVMKRYPLTLRKALAHGMPPDKALLIFRDILVGVDAAHVAGVWHRDLKPENILLSDHETVVADFGIAHFSAEAIATPVETVAGRRLANVNYAAPEQRKRNGVVDHRADIFALGLILNEMFTGEVPHGTGFKRVGEASAAHAFLDGAIDAMIDQAPEKRPQSIESVRRLIEHNAAT